MATQTQPRAAMCCMSGMACRSLRPVIQAPPWTWRSTGAFAGVALGGTVDVEHPPPPVRRVGDVAVHVDPRLAHPQGVEQLAPRGGQLGGGGRRVQLLDVLDAEPLDQRVLDVVPGLLALPDEVGEAERAGAPRGPGRPGCGGRGAGGTGAAPRRRAVRASTCGRQLAVHPAGGEGGDPGALAGQGAQGVGGEGGDHALAAEEAHVPMVSGQVEPVLIMRPTAQDRSTWGPSRPGP